MGWGRRSRHSSRVRGQPVHSEPSYNHCVDATYLEVVAHIQESRNRHMYRCARRAQIDYIWFPLCPGDILKIYPYMSWNPLTLGTLNPWIRNFETIYFG